VNEYKRWALIGALIADVAFNVIVLVQNRKRDRAWAKAVADDVEKIPDGTATVSE
jgi:hypothetical protein